MMTADIQSQPAVPLPPSIYVPTTLRDGYHVFISYSSTDYQWTHSLINQLESCDLQVCYHERDFTPDPNPLFRDCLERKPIIPALLDPGVSVPLHLCHLTYLEANDPDFMNKLLKVLCTPSHQPQGSTVVPFQPPSIYDGKALQPLNAVNDEGLYKWDSGLFSHMEVPDQLRLIIEDHERYRKAVRMINSVSQNKVRLCPLWVRVLIYVIGSILSYSLLAGIILFMIVIYDGKILPQDETTDHIGVYVVIIFSCAPLGLIIPLALWKKDDEKHILREMQKAIGQANTILSDEKVFMGCCSNSKNLSGVCFSGRLQT